MSSAGNITANQNRLRIGMVQYHVVVKKPEDVQASVDRICQIVRDAKQEDPALDILAFPEYSSAGLNNALWSYDEFLIAVDSPQVDQFRAACRDAKVWGVFSIIEPNHQEGKAPFNTALVIDDSGEIALHYRKLQPWAPVEPWYPGDLGMQVCEGPKGSRLAIAVCHDGMFPEIAREAAYKGANVYLRISGYHSEGPEYCLLADRSNAFQNMMYTAGVNLSGHDGAHYHFPEGHIISYDGTVIATGNHTPMEIVTADVFPELADEARRNWALENNLYELGHRGYVAVDGGARENYLTWVEDLAQGNYRLPWEDEVAVKDGWTLHPDGPRLGPMPRG